MAMRKVFYGPEGIVLKHVMRLYDKENLLNYAMDLDRGEKMVYSLYSKRAT